jgi:hypothetical protein
LLIVVFATPVDGSPRRDTDHDGLVNRFELTRSHTHPRRKDTDGDRLSDGYELLRLRTNPQRRDTDRDHLGDRYEVRVSRTSPRRTDSDADGLSDGYELRTSHTDPRKRDTDGDGLNDGYEVLITQTDPCTRDTDGDGLTDGQEVALGSNPLEPSSPPAPETTPPDTTILSGPTGTVTGDSASFSFSSGPGAAFECRIDGGTWAYCSSPKSYSGLSNGSHVFDARATDAAGNVDPTPASRNWTIGTSSGGSTYYVSTTGNDSNPGTQSAPWRTIGKAASTVTSAGSRVVVGAGSYAEDVALAKSGGAGSPIVFSGGGTATVRSVSLRASHLVLDGFIVSGATGHCVAIYPALTDLAVENNEITNCGRDGIRFVRPENTGAAYSTAVTVRGNRIHGVGKSDTWGNALTVYADGLLVENNDLSDTPNDAIDMWGPRHAYRHNTIHDISNPYGHHNDAFQTWVIAGDGASGLPLTELMIERNTVRNIAGSNAHGIMAEGPGHHDWAIRSNVWHAVGSYGMIFGCCGSPGMLNVLVYNNTFVNVTGADTVQYQAGATGKVANNIFYNSRNPLYISSGSSAAHDYNLSGGSTPRLSEAHAVNADPLFVNNSGNFHLQNGSPAIDGGDDGSLISPVRSQDLDGDPTMRVADIGAYEAP